MKDIIPAKKQSPILGLTGMGGGVGGNLGGSLAKDPLYIDELFNTYLYKGTNGSKVANTGLDMTKGGMVWWKNRTANSTQHILIDTVRGENKVINSDSSGAEFTGNYSQTFTSTGWTMNNGFADLNNVTDYVSWNFRERKGFFDIVQYSGTGSVQNISHDLETIPGCIMVKRTDSSAEWTIWHRSAGNTRGSTPGRVAATAYLTFQNTQGQTHDSTVWNDTDPTKNQFTVGSSTKVNASGGTYIAYIFAHGTGAGQHTTGLPTSHVKSPNGVYASNSNPPTMSTGPHGVANTAVTFNGTTKHPLTVIAGPDLNPGNQDWTYECWFKGDSATWSRQWSMLMSRWQDQGIYIGLRANGYAGVYDTINASNSNFNLGWTQDTWHHLAVVRSGSSCRIFLDGTLKDTFGDGNTYDNKYGNLDIGSSTDNNGASQEEFSGQISNLRVTIGQAIYWNNFTPATSNLTLTSQGADAAKVQFLGLNGDSNADYEEANKFGENEDQPIIKCGSYDGASEISVICGFEPQLVLIKAYSGYANGNCDWLMIDSMRGLNAKDANEVVLRPNKTNNEASYDNFHMSVAEWTDANNGPLGFTGTGGYDNSSNAGNGPYLYIAIRRVDGLVGKPPQAATDVFTMDAGNGQGNHTPPEFTSGFPVDFAFYKRPAISDEWITSARLIQGKYLQTQTSGAENSAASMSFDNMTGWMSDNLGSNYQSWMWKRHAGFDVVTYGGDGSPGRSKQHSLGKVPEMIWIKGRFSENWLAWHYGLNNGTNAYQYALELNNSQAEVAYAYQSAAPTARDFSIGTHGMVNENGKFYIAMLFASVDGISKCGYYDGSGSDITITTGFQPRFVIIKAVNNARGWTVMDTLRGWGAGVDNKIYLNEPDPQVNTWNYGQPTATGFTVSHSQYDINYTGWKYIYYAHA